MPTRDQNASPVTDARFLTFSPVSEKEFDAIVRRCNLTTCAFDPVDHNKVTPHFLKQFQMRIVNSVLSSAVFPLSEKRALIHPILKDRKLDSDEMASYRPVSNVTYPSKLIETAIYMQLSEYLQENELVPPNQSAYRPNHSTETVLTKLHSDIIQELDQGRHVMALSLDMSSAFDSIDHSLLMNELECLGIGGQALDLLKSYLMGRKIQVAALGVTSQPKPLEFGVPQGSVLGPLLFILYVRKLSQILESLGVKHQIYADDTQVYAAFEDSDLNCMKSKMEEVLKTVKDWLRSMSLKLNVLKTTMIIFSPMNKKHIIPNDFHLLVNGEKIPMADQTKILGVIFDKDLKFEPQIGAVIKACNFSLHNLRLAKRYIPRKFLIETVTSEILSRIDYCNTLYLRIPKMQLQRLQSIMNRAARRTYGLKWRQPTSTFLQKLH